MTRAGKGTLVPVLRRPELVAVLLAGALSACASGQHSALELALNTSPRSTDLGRSSAIYIHDQDLWTKRSQEAATPCPTGYRVRRAIFLADREHILFEGERGLMAVLDPAGQITEVLAQSDEPRTFAGVSEDDQLFFWSTARGDGRPTLHRVDARQRRGEPESLLRLDREWTVAREPLSSDGRWLFLHRVRSNRDVELYGVDLSRGSTTAIALDLSDGKKEVLFASRDQVVYADDGSDEFPSLRRIQLGPTPASPETVLEAVEGELIIAYETSPDAQWTLIGRMKRGIESFELRRDGELIALPTFGGDRIVEAHLRGSDLALMVGSDRRPAAFYRYRLPSHELELIADLSKVQAEHLVAGEARTITSFDGLDIPAVLYRPRGADEAHPAKAVVHVHGGPSSQARRRYDPSLQYLVHRGYAVLDVDYRGSSGYGKTFESLNDLDHGGGDLKDVLAARAYLGSVPWIDAKKVAIMGASYGGYLTAAALAFSPESFAAGIDMMGVTSWARLLAREHRRGKRFDAYFETEYGDLDKVRARLESVSPALHTDAIRAPLLVVQGGQDSRVPADQSAELVSKVMLAGRPVKYVYLPREGHGFRSATNLARVAEATVDFLQANLGPSQAASQRSLP